MAFDWADYERLAQQLRHGDEAAQRTAISRLYYSVYHRALLNLEQTSGFVYSPNKPSHQQVWDAYLKQGGTFRAIGNKGKRLRVNRELADYAAEIKHLEEIVEEAFLLADRILHWLKQIQPPRPSA